MAANTFTDLYIAAQGGCSNSAVSPLAFVFAGQSMQSPFGKPAEDWSEDDLAALRSTLATCQTTAAQAGNPYVLEEIRQQSDDVLTRVPQIVAKAKALAEAKTQQVEARRQMAVARINEALRVKQQARASAETEAVHLEQQANAAEADARDAQQHLDRRIERATRARNEAKARTAAIASLERRADEDLGMLPKVLPAPPGELSELVQDDNALSSGKEEGVPTATVTIDTPACRIIDDVEKSQQASSPRTKSDPQPGASGECRTLAKGTRVTIEAAAAGKTTRALCVGLSGQPGCFWAAKSAFVDGEQR